VIGTLQKLRERPLEELEAELKSFSRRRQMVLLLPALFSEFETPAMPRIIQELQGVDYLEHIVLSLDRAGEKEFREARKKMSVLSADVKIVWHDGPRMQKFYKELKKNDFDLKMPGKGRSVWMTSGTFCRTGTSTPSPCTIATSSIIGGRSSPGFSIPSFTRRWTSSSARGITRG